jgi:hypothetical protein
MYDPANNKQAAVAAAARWKVNKDAELKEQIIATFRLQRALANEAAGNQGTAALARTQVKNIWKDAFAADPIPGFDFTTDDGTAF